MDMKKLIQTMTDIEGGKTPLNESAVAECGDMGATAPAVNQGTPVTASITLNASGMEHVADLMRLIQKAGLEPEGPPAPAVMPMRQDMERLRDIVGRPEMEADAAYSDVIKDDEDLDEGMDPKALMGQIRKMAKGVETSKDDREHQMFASQVESDLIDLFQYYNQVQRDTEKQEIVRNLIRQNKKAQQQADLRNANNIVSVLWDLMNANEAFVNEPDEEYADHTFMTHDLAGGINKPKKMFKPAAKGDNPMAVESFKDKLYKALSEKKAKPDFLDMDKDGDKKEPMKKAVADKKKVNEAAKPDFLDMDKDGDKKEPMKKALKDKKKKSPVKEGAPAFSPKYIQHLQIQYGDKKVLDRSDKYKIADIIKKSSIENLKQLVAANIPHVSNAAKNYIKNNTPGGMVRPLETIGEDWELKLDAIDDLIDQARAAFPDREHPIHLEIAKLIGAVNRGSLTTSFVRNIKQMMADGSTNESDSDWNTRAALSLLKMKHDANKKFKKSPMTHVASVLDPETIAGLTRRKMKHDAEKKYKDSLRKKTSDTKEAEFQAPTHELDDTARKAMNIAQKIKRKINSGEQMDDRDYNQMAELGAILSRFGTSFGPKSMKDVMAHMVQYTNDRNEEGHGYPEFDVNRFKELMAMASGKSESYAPVSEISKDTADRYYRKAAKDIGNRTTSAIAAKNDAYHSQFSDRPQSKNKDEIKARIKNTDRKIKNRATGMSRASARMENVEQIGEISSDLAKRYTKAAKMDRDFNDDDIARLSKSGQSTQAMHRRNSKRTKGINQAKKRM